MNKQERFEINKGKIPERFLQYIDHYEITTNRMDAIIKFPAYIRNINIKVEITV